MSDFLKISALILLITSFLACKNDDPSREEAATAAAEEVAAMQAPLSDAIGKIAYRSGNNFTLDNNSTVSMPPLGDTSYVTFFVMRHAETMEGKTSLSDDGRARAGALAGFLEDAKLAQVYVEGNGAIQTANMAAQANQAEVNLFKPKQVEDIVKMALGNFKGKRVLMIGTAETVPQILNVIAGKIVEGKMAENQFDDFFIAKVNKLGEAEITHLKY